MRRANRDPHSRGDATYADCGCCVGRTALPSRPKLPAPQHCTSPLASTAQLWLEPALTWVALVVPVTATGVPLPVVLPLPSWPLAPAPQHCTHAAREQRAAVANARIDLLIRLRSRLPNACRNNGEREQEHEKRAAGGNGDTDTASH